MSDQGLVPNSIDNRGSSEIFRKAQYLKSICCVPPMLQMHDKIRPMLQEERLSSDGEVRRDIGVERKLASLLIHVERYLNLITKRVL